MARRREDLFFHQQRFGNQPTNGNGASRASTQVQGVPADSPARDGDVVNLQKMGYNSEDIAHRIGEPFNITASHRSTPIASRCMGKIKGDTFIMKQPVQGRQREWYVVNNVTPKEKALEIDNAVVQEEASGADATDGGFVTGTT